MLTGRWQRLDVTVRDTLGAFGLLGIALLPGMDGMGADVPEYPAHRPMDALGWALVVSCALPLALRRRWPVTVTLATGTAFVLYEVLGYPISASTLGFVFALYALGAYQHQWRRELGIALVVAYLPFVLVLDSRGSTQTVLQYVMFLATLAAFWVAGRWMREQRAKNERQRRTSAALAVAAERQRIARELHDVVTHHVTAMVLQADAARLALGGPVSGGPDLRGSVSGGLASGGSASDGPASDGPALRGSAEMAAVSATGREALTELRHLLHVLDGDEGPAAGSIEDLVERTRALGQPVSVREEGSGEVGLTVYRVVQESLTNAVKYARGRPTVVHIAHTDGTVAVEVTTHGTSGEFGGAGRGLNGLRERVAGSGGDFEAGPVPGGAFVVRATIPATIPATNPATIPATNPATIPTGALS